MHAPDDAHTTTNDAPPDGAAEPTAAVDGTTIALFFTFGVTMRAWFEDGMLDREVAVYNRLADHADRVYLFTYGDASDRAYADHLADNVEVVPKRRVHNDLLYSFLAPLVHYRLLREVDVVKTNQMLGSWTALLAKYLCGPALVVRTGYVLSTFYDELGKPLPIRAVATTLEAVAYCFADAVFTSSPRGYAYVEDRYWVRGDHLMLPNYIETDVFRPIDVDTRPDSLCFVGRLAPQKNLRSLLTALGATPYRLTVVGDGGLRDDLDLLADEVGADVTFVGRVPNHDLPALLNEHEAFVLPSKFEGMPKTLLEAMSCGLAVVGTDVQGINEVVTHEEDGLLCETDPGSIRAAIERVMTDAALRETLGTNARRTIETEYSLDTIAGREAALYGRLVRGAG
jgi:glycosyltransferase involved in cell wall biosynthesis